MFFCGKYNNPPWCRNGKSGGALPSGCETTCLPHNPMECGNGLWVDCINPIMEGRAQRSTATKPLPQVDPHIVAACKASNPRFGQPKATQSEAGEQPSPTRPLPPAA